MPDTIIGLDLGSAGLKAVYLRRGFRGLEWVKAVEREWPAGWNPLDWISASNGLPESGGGEAPLPDLSDAAVSAIRSTWVEMAVGRANVIVSVPAHFCSIRMLSLPFSDERRIMQVVPYEVEPLLPFPLDEMVVDHQPLVTAEGQSRLLVAAVRKRTLDHLLKLLSKAGIDPAMVELDALSLLTLAQYGIKARAPECLAMVDIGAAKTSVLVLDQGYPRFVRTYLQGSRQWTQAIERAMSLTGPAAEEQKRHLGLNDGVSGALQDPLQAWSEELSRTLHVAQGECEHPLGGVVLCGGGARLKGFETFIRTSLELEVRHLELPLLREKNLAWDSAWSHALGLALRGGGLRKGSRINFRKGEFSYQKEIAQTRKKARWIWAGLGLLLILGATDLALKYRIQAARYESIRADLRQMFSKMFPDIRNVVDELHQAETSLGALKKKLALFGTQDKSALRVLGELTLRIPETIEIEVRELSIEPERVRLQAETESFEAVDRIKASVMESDLFTSAEVSNAKILTDKGKVRFDLTLRLDSSEDRG